MPESSASLARLRRRVARIEGVRPGNGVDRFGTGHAAIDSWLGGGLARGRLHEMLADDGKDAGILSGFAAMLALRIDTAKPLLWLRSETAEREAGKLYATGLSEIGLSGGDLILGSLADDAALLKAANDAARASLPGFTASERETLARGAASTEMASLGLDTSQTTIAVNQSGEIITVSIAYDGRQDAFLNLGMIPLPSRTIQRIAAVRLGGL